jgi:Domain of unknown function (DUF4340)
MRGLRTTIGLTVVLGGLFAYIYFVTWKQPAETPGPKQEKVFASLEADKIDELRVKSESGDASTLKKEKDGWRIAEPVATAAAETEVSGITSALSQLEMVRLVEEKPANLNDYGLASPRIEIDFKAAGDKDFRSLLIGQKSPAGGNLFAKRKGDDKVFLIAGFQEQTFNRTTFDLRDKAALHFERDKVDRIAIDAGGKALELAKSGNDWSLTRPVKTAADFSAVEGLVGRLLSAQMKSIASDSPSPADLKKYGLDKPAATVSLGMGSATAALQIGGKAADGSLYARDASKPLVMTIDSTLVDELKKGPDDYRRKDLFAFRAYDANRLELTRGGQTVAFDKIKGANPTDEDKWQRAGVNGAKPVDADKEKMGVFLAKLESIRATAFVDSTAKTGLDSPALAVYAKFDDNKKEERVTFGKSGDTVYASRGSEPGAAKVSAAEFDEIVKKLDELAK